ASAWAGPASFISCVLEAGAVAPTLPLPLSIPISMVFPPNRTRREKSCPFPRQSYRQLTLAQQAEDRLRQLVGLGQHRSTRLLHDLVLGQVGRLGCVVGVQYAAAGSGGVLSNVLQVADGRLEAVLHRTQLGTFAVDLLHGTVQNLNGLLRAVSGGDVQVGYAGFLNNCFMLNSIGGGDAQGIQTGAGRAVSDGEVILGEKTQLTCVVGGSHTGAGGIDRTDDGLHVAALGQLHFSAVQGDRGVKVQLGIGGSSLQTQLTGQTAVAVRIGQLDRRTIGGFQSDTAAGNSTSHCAIGSGADGCKNGVYIVSGSNSYSFTIDGEVASHTQHRSEEG